MAIKAFQNLDPKKMTVTVAKPNGINVRVGYLQAVKGTFFQPYGTAGILTEVADATSIDPQSLIVYTAPEVVEGVTAIVAGEGIGAVNTAGSVEVSLADGGVTAGKMGTGAIVAGTGISVTLTDGVVTVATA